MTQGRDVLFIRWEGRGACSCTDTQGRGRTGLSSVKLLNSRDAGGGLEGEIDLPPKCSAGFTGYLLIRARAIYSRQKERRLRCQKQNKRHSRRCRLLFLPGGRCVVSLSYAVTQTSRDQLDSTGASCLSVLLGSAVWDASPVIWPWRGGGGSKHSIDPCGGCWWWHYLCYNCPKGCGLRELDLPYLHKLRSTLRKTAATGESMHPFPCHLFLQSHLPLLSPEYRGIFQTEGNSRHIAQACNMCLNRCETSTLQPDNWSNEWCLLHHEMQVCG